jgi:hypothetical protein
VIDLDQEVVQKGGHKSSFRALKVKTFPLSSFKLSTQSIQTITMLLAGEGGCQILLHGVPESGRTTLASSACAVAGKGPVYLEATGNPMSELESAQEAYKDGHTVVVLDDCGELLACGNPFFESLPKLFLVDYLQKNQLCLIWVADDIANIPGGIISLFDYVVELKEPFKSEFSWPTAVPAEWHPDLKKYLDLSEAELSRCLSVWTRTRSVGEEASASKSRLLDLLESRPRSRRGSDKGNATECLHPFELGLVNTDKSLQEVEDSIGTYLKWLECNPNQRQPYAVLCSGPPGTGKTAWAQHVARTFKRPLATHSYGDLVSPMVGVTEQNLAKAFHEAEAEGAVLFLDEVEGLLTSREVAKNSWERTQVSEMLLLLQAHRGLVIACTNMLSTLDGALSRRMMAKVQFNPLRGEEQLALAWKSYFPNLSVPSGRLIDFARTITAGDFRLVADYFKFRSSPPDQDQVLKALHAEQIAKQRFSDGGRASRVGFHG